MVSRAAQGLKLLYIPKKGPFDSDVGSRIPEAYKKFYAEWKWKKPAAVHYKPPVNEVEVDHFTGQVKLIKDSPLPVIYPPEHNEGLWGGEGIIKGFQKRHPLRRRVPHFWVPTLKKSVVYSEILDMHIEVIVTDRLIRLIHENFGFDHYLLKTPACDLKSTLALQIKRKLLLALSNNSLYPTNPGKKSEVLNKYKPYVLQYTKEEIEWYGLTLSEAFKKLRVMEDKNDKPAGLKNTYRSELIQKLKEAGIKEANLNDEPADAEKKSWLSRINMFSKDGKTSDRNI